MQVVIYNVTLNVKKQIHGEWLKWYKEIHIPAVMQTGCFTDCKLYRVIHNDEIDFTYRLHFFCNTMQDYIRYEANFADELKKEHSKTFPQIVSTRTLLEEIKL